MGRGGARKNNHCAKHESFFHNVSDFFVLHTRPSYPQGTDTPQARGVPRWEGVYGRPQHLNKVIFRKYYHLFIAAQRQDRGLTAMLHRITASSRARNGHISGCEMQPKHIAVALAQ
jgi:hypothetical protein